MNITIILSLLGAVAQLFQGYIGTPLESLIQTGLAALGTLIASWVKGSPASDITASLTALQAVLTALQNEEANNPTALPQIIEIIKIVEAAIQGYQTAEATDPGTLPVPPAVQ
jgi:flagellar motor component MotA